MSIIALYIVQVLKLLIEYINKMKINYTNILVNSICFEEIYEYSMFYRIFFKN